MAASAISADEVGVASASNGIRWRAALAGLGARLTEPLEQGLGAERLQFQRRGRAAGRQGSRRTARPLLGEKGDAAQPGGAQHRLAEVVLVDGVTARGRVRLQRPYLRTVVELQQRPTLAAVQHEAVAVFGDIAPDRRRVDLPRFESLTAEQALAEVSGGRPGWRDARG
jgi:hypothetical protein